MFLLKNKYFYFLAAITIGILLGFSIWGYLALMNNGGHQSYEIKYIAECFIFSALLATSFIAGLFIFLHHRSVKIYKELDKMYELFDRGNYYTQNSFKKLGPLGEKIIRINRHLITVNELKTKKISSDSKIMNFLLRHTHEELLVLKNNGIIVKASKEFYDKNEVDKEIFIGSSIDNMVEKFEFSNIFEEMNKGQVVALKRKVFLKADDENGAIKYLVFFPIFNITNNLSNSICIFVSEGRFKKYKASMNNDPINENVYKSSSIMRKISGLFNQNMP
ncbi:MAG: hypothetical protein JXQ65_08740 [Candidatus Marinimicrobia bacterium]|nr:hypothetical protein [Candidatus Neomarinimicrobiota bacterium]